METKLRCTVYSATLTRFVISPAILAAAFQTVELRVVVCLQAEGYQFQHVR
jgi:hypothetical protein